MKRINLILLLLAAITLSSCARSCQGIERSFFDNEKHKVRIIHYSGGKIVGEWEIFGIVNNSEGSDGFYFYDENNKLVEISGDVRLQYLD